MSADQFLFLCVGHIREVCIGINFVTNAINGDKNSLIFLGYIIIIIINYP